MYVYIFGCAKTQNQSKVKPAWNPRYGHNANLWSEFNYVLIGTQLLRSRFLWLQLATLSLPRLLLRMSYLAAGTCWASCWAGRQLMLRSLTLKAKMLWFTHTHTHTQIQQWRNCICGAWHAFYVPLRAARGVALASLNQLTNKYLAASCHSQGRGWGRAEGGRRNVGKSKATLWPCRIQRLIPYGRSAQAY